MTFLVQFRAFDLLLITSSIDTNCIVALSLTTANVPDMEARAFRKSICFTLGKLDIIGK